MTIQKFALTAVMLSAIAILLLASTGARRGRGCNPDLILSGCAVASQDKIEWEQKPSITADGYLVMRGRTKDGERIHDARSGNADGYIWPAFNMSNLKQISDDDSRLEIVASIWPRYMSSRFDSDSSDLFANPDEYQVTDSEFYVKVKIPDALLSDDIRLVVSVWPPISGDPPQSLVAECVDRE